MKYEICEMIAKHFIVYEAEGNVYYIKRTPKGNGEDLVEIKAEIVNNLEKAFIYAYAYFDDAVNREIAKLIKRINEITNEVRNDSSIDTGDIGKLYLAVSSRTRRVLGNSNLDALIKEHFAEKGGRHIALVPEEEEENAYFAVKEAIFNECVKEFVEGTLKTSMPAPIENYPNRKTVMMSAKYLIRMTSLQQKLIKAALKIVALEEGMRLDNVEVAPTWQVFYAVKNIGGGFDEIEAEILDDLKRLIDNDGNVPPEQEVRNQ